MNKPVQEAAETYYGQAASWAHDSSRAARTSQRIVLWVAVSSSLIAILEAGALWILMPLKTVEPYTLLVDRSTGYVQPLKPLDPQKTSPDAALTQSFLVQYVIARESFDFNTVSADYKKVGLFSSGQARTTYLAAIQPSNPASPLRAYSRGTVIDTRVKSMSPIGRETVLVRFETIRSDANGRAEPPRPWVAVVQYRYSGEPLSLEDRFVNPLGFQVVRYRRDQETLAPPLPSRPEDSGSGISGPPLPNKATGSDRMGSSLTTMPIAGQP